MKPYAATFYKSKAWKQCRAAYLASIGGLCEECLKRGVYTPAEIVHHKVWITPQNINNPNVVLSWSNLKAVCRKCHAMEHESDYAKRPKRVHVGRYTVNKDGSVEILHE